MIADILCGNAEYDEKALNDKENYLFVHRDMIKELVSLGIYSDYDCALNAVTDKVNNVCKNILFNTAVFKDDETGKNGFNKFLASCGIKNI